MDLDRFKWKNRILIILHPAQDPELLNAQIINLKNDDQGLLERKLLLISVNEKGYQVLDGTQDFVRDSALYRKLRKVAGGHHILLIGLDGGVKHRSKIPLGSEELFSIIDGMPMRRSELRSKN